MGQGGILGRHQGVEESMLGLGMFFGGALAATRQIVRIEDGGIGVVFAGLHYGGRKRRCGRWKWVAWMLQ